MAAEPLALPLIGGCICGKLRYAVRDTPLAVMMCHGPNCQQRTGSAFSLAILTFRKDFEVFAGGTLSADLPAGAAPCTASISAPTA